MRNQHTLNPYQFAGGIITEIPYACLCLLLVCLGLCRPGWATEGLGAQIAGITTILQDGFNLIVEEQLTPHYVIVKMDPPIHNWFAGTVTKLPTDQEVTIGISLAEMGGKNYQADVSKWVDLHPVMTYADPTKYETYEWFRRDEQGRWASGDPFKQGEAKYAGTGKLPKQTVIPADLAEKFLSPDGTYWSPWRDIELTEALTGANVFRIKQHFAASTATIAMRIPYTYWQQLVQQINTLRLPGVTVDELGTTPNGRAVQLLCITDPTDLKAKEHTTLIIAREHATEPAGSWVTQGVLSTLLSDEGIPLRAHRTWLLISLLDPDGSAEGVFDRLTERFVKTDDPPPPVEVVQYLRYFTEYVARGGQFDISLSLHNLEAQECANVFCPFVDFAWSDQIIDFNRTLFAKLRANGYRTTDPASNWGMGFLTFRIYEWVAMHYHALALAFEVNDRYPSNRLTLAQLEDIGTILSAELVRWQESAFGIQWHDDAAIYLQKHRDERNNYFNTKHRDPSQRSLHEIITLAY